MFRRHSVIVYLLLLALVIFGAWLNGQFIDDVSEVSFLRLISGLIIMMGALIGIILLIRHDMRPMDQRVLTVWGVIRAKGRRNYLRGAVVRGVIFGLVLFLWPLISHLWKAESFASVADSLWVYVALYLTCVFGVYYAAVRTWDANEKAYEALFQSKARHNNAMQSTTQ